MSVHTEMYQRICEGCPIRDKCYSKGEIPQEGCGLLLKMRNPDSDITLRAAIQFKVMELYRLNRFKFLGYDIGFEGVLNEWSEERRDKDFAWAYEGGRNFVLAYRRMAALNPNGVPREQEALVA